MRLHRWGEILADLLGDNKALWVVSFFISLLSVIDIPFSPVFGFSPWLIFLYLVTVSCLKATIITVVLAKLKSMSNAMRAVAYFLLLLYFLLSLVNAGSFYFYNFGISRKLLVIISQTNIKETGEFLPGLWYNLKTLFSSLGFWFIMLVAVMVTDLIYNLGKKSFVRVSGGLSMAGLALIVVLAVIFPLGKTAHFISFRLLRYSYDVYKTNKAFAELVEKRKPFPYAEQVESSHLTPNIVLLIGESASRQHHSLYGYPLPTTPRLASMSDSLIVFNNAIGSSISTAGNIERILTFKEDDLTCNDWYEFPLITELFSTAGYKTYYVSNQERTGVIINSSGVIAETADVVKYVGAENSADALVANYDEAVVPFVKQYLAEPADNKFIVAHLMGSHAKYANRYPQRFNRFSASDVMRISKGKSWIDRSNAATVAEYDNSILYTDNIVSQILDAASRQKEPTIVIYFADHGENIFDDRAFIGREEKYVEVPFIIYANRAFREANGELLDKMREMTNAPISTANIVYPMMTLTGTVYPPYYNPSKDFLSPEFGYSKRLVDEHVWKYETQRPSDSQPNGASKY